MPAPADDADRSDRAMPPTATDGTDRAGSRPAGHRSDRAAPPATAGDDPPPRPGASEEPAAASDADPSVAAEGTPLVTLVDDGPDGRRCTVCPATADAADLVTTWLTVDEAAVRDLADWR